MPELPEVETTRQGIIPHVIGEKIIRVQVRNPSLRWPVPGEVQQLSGKTITRIDRRAKYLLARTPCGTLLMHLGMSGSLRICQPEIPLRKHDHFILHFNNNTQLRLHDPRRFGAVLFYRGNDGNQPLLNKLGPEPLEPPFSPQYLHNSCRGRKTTIKQHIMNNKMVVGVGNIYACEALYRSGIHPKRQAGRISKQRLAKLTREIKKVLQQAITQGGTTLRDFLNQDGQPGYFKQQLAVYDRQNRPCRACNTPIKKLILSNRSTFYCPRCQH